MRRWTPQLRKPTDEIEERIAGAPIGLPASRMPARPSSAREYGFVCQLRAGTLKLPAEVDFDWLFLMTSDYAPFLIPVRQNELTLGASEFSLRPGEGKFPGFAIDHWREDDDGVSEQDYRRRLDGEFPEMSEEEAMALMDIWPPSYIAGSPVDWKQDSYYPVERIDAFIGNLVCAFTDEQFLDSDIGLDDFAQDLAGGTSDSPSRWLELGHVAYGLWLINNKLP